MKLTTDFKSQIRMGLIGFIVSQPLIIPDFILEVNIPRVIEYPYPILVLIFTSFFISRKICAKTDDYFFDKIVPINVKNGALLFGFLMVEALIITLYKNPQYGILAFIVMLLVGTLIGAALGWVTSPASYFLLKIKALRIKESSN